MPEIQPNKPVTPRRKSPAKPRKPRKKESWIRRHSMPVMIGCLAVVAFFIGVLLFAFAPHAPREGGDWVYIPKGSSTQAVKDSLRNSLGRADGTRVYMLWRLMGGGISNAEGAYRVDFGQTALSVARRIATGRQTPVSVSFKSARKLDMVAGRIASQLEFSAEEFLDACDKVLPDHGFKKAQFPAAFIPDTYEFYWDVAPEKAVERLLAYRDDFWTQERLDKAEALGLSKVEVATVASIIEEESAKRDERPKIARLYLNRLAKGMRLQADPTVKFAVGDFSLRRITGAHLKTSSTYNTYQHAGLPPGPIRIPEARDIDAVLDAPHHQYLYMCAREDFSGYHNFAVDYATHQANARRYQSELNRRGIR